MKFRIGKNRKNKTIGFKEILPDIINEFDVKESFVIVQLKQKWSYIAGSIISDHSAPLKIYRKTLFISVDHSIFSNEIMMMRDSILKKISEIISENIIVNIKTDIKSSRWKR